MPIQKIKFLLVGGNGMLARKIAASAPSEYQITSVDLPDFDITDQAQVCSVIEAFRPEIIINCAAYTNVDGCETEQVLANRVNGTAVGYLAEAAKAIDAVLVHFSTDYVFDGKQKRPYLESDPPCPQSVYGHSKLLGEKELQASGLKKFFIVRTSWLYGPGGNNFVETILRLAAERVELRIVSDQVGTPTYTGDLANAVFRLLKAADRRARITDHPPFGIYHFSNEGQCSWYQFAKEIVTMAEKRGIALRVKNILPINTVEYPLPAKRPAYSVFDKSRYKTATGAEIPAWRDSLKVYLSERQEHK